MRAQLAGLALGAGIVLLCLLVALGLLVAAAVAGLVPLMGVPLALLLVAGGVLAVALVVAVVLRRAARRMLARQRQAAMVTGALRVGLAVLPRGALRRLELAALAGVAVAVAAFRLLPGDREA